MDIEATVDCEYRDSSEEEDDRRFSLTADLTPRRLSSNGKSLFTSRQSFRLIESFYDTPNHQKKAGEQLRRSFVVSREHMALGDVATMFDADQQSPNATTFAADSSNASSCDDSDADSCDTLDLLVRADSDSVAGLSQGVRANTDSTQLPASRLAIRADEFIFPHRLTHQTATDRALHSASNHSLSLSSLPSMGSMPCVLAEDAFRFHCESPLPTLRRAPSPAQGDALPMLQAMQAQLHELLTDAATDAATDAGADREWSYTALSATVFRSAAARLCWSIATLATDAGLPLCALQHLLSIVALYEAPHLAAVQWSGDSSPVAVEAAGDEEDDGPAGFLVAVLQQLALQWLAMEDAERGLGLLTTAAELRQRIFGSDGELTAFPALAAQRVCRLVRLEHRLYALQDRLPLDVVGLATADAADDVDLDDRARELRVHVEVAQVFVAEEMWPAALHHFHQALALLAAPSVCEGAAVDDALAQLELRAQLCMSLSWLYAQLRDEAMRAYYEGEADALRRRLYGPPDGDDAAPPAASRAPSPATMDGRALPLDGAALPTAAAPGDTATTAGDGCVVS